MTESTDPRIVALVQDLARRLEADRCTLYVVDHARREVRSLVALGLEIPGIRLSMNRGVVGYVARTGHALNLKDVYNDPRFDRAVDRETGYRSKSMLTMAIRDDANRVIGVVQALNKRSETFTQADEDIMQAFCRDVVPLLKSRLAAGGP